MAFSSNTLKLNFQQFKRSHAINLWFFFQCLLELSFWSFCLRSNISLCQHLKVLSWRLFWCCFCWSIRFKDWWTVVRSIALKLCRSTQLLFWRFNHMFRYTSILDIVWFRSFLLIKLSVKRFDLFVLFTRRSCKSA